MNNARRKFKLTKKEFTGKLVRKSHLPHFDLRLVLRLFGLKEAIFVRCDWGWN